MKFFPILIIIMWVSALNEQILEQRTISTVLKVPPGFAFAINQLHHISTKLPKMKDNAAFGK